MASKSLTARNSKAVPKTAVLGASLLQMTEEDTKEKVDQIIGTVARPFPQKHGVNRQIDQIA